MNVKNEKFNRVIINMFPSPEYYENPWRYFTEFVSILKSRGAQFITMREAIEKRFDKNKINILLDHHIDSFPLELEIMCRWEKENGLRSSVYLYNESTRCVAVSNGGVFRIEDLNIEFYQELESEGFEIGYHQNAVGRARKQIKGKVRGTSFDYEVESRAKEIFREDMSNLRKYFCIDTFVPHGGGQANWLLTNIPKEFNNLVWVYNKATDSRLPRKRPEFDSWSDAAPKGGFNTQLILGFQAHYLCRRDNLHTKAFLATEDNLHHILIHPGRFARGMPYDKILNKSVPKIEKTDWKVELPLPFTMHDVARSVGIEIPAITEKLGGSRTIKSATIKTGRAYRLLTNDTKVLGIHLLCQSGCIAYFVQNRKFNRRKDLSLIDHITTENGINDANFSIANIYESFASDSSKLSHFKPFFNEIFCLKLLNHLYQSSLVFDVVEIHSWPVKNIKELELFCQVICKYATIGAVLHFNIKTKIHINKVRNFFNRESKLLQLKQNVHLSISPCNQNRETDITVESNIL